MKANRATLGWQDVGIIAVAAAIGLGVYLTSSAARLRIGFPLDDAWIHQTYARNLALLGQWAYVPGEVSAGSTAPLWSLLLAPGYRFGFSPYLWTFALGWAALSGVGLAGQAAFRRSFGFAPRFPFVGVFLAVEWHLVWAAGSGMETAAYAAICLVFFDVLSGEIRHGWGLGALIGLAIWMRPDGITLLGPLGMVLALDRRGWVQKLRVAIEVGAGLLVLGGGYLVFNQALAGAWWPNTFFAKQAEYAALLQIPLVERLGQMYLQPLVGAGILLLPGAAFSAVRGVRERRWWMPAMLLWWAGFTLVYALRLPVVYQHARYLIPAMPAFFLAGLMGTADLLKLLKPTGWATRMARPTLVISIAAVQAMFFILGARTYAGDVAIIETEMVQTAHWLRDNTPPDAILAVHDIGAVGYFSERRLLDLAGLISPDVIPFIRDETRLAEYLDAQGADYLVTFPEWYPELVAGREVLFTSGGVFAPLFGQENMRVYRWK